MCIAIYNHDNVLSHETIKNCWVSNGDGAGMLWVENGVLNTHKQLDNLDSFYAKYKQIRSVTDTVVLHFRIRTHGKVDINNIHPFLVNDDLGLVHNGIISQTSYSKSDYSDTYHFTEFLRSMPPNFHKYDACMELIADYIGVYNKLIFLGSDGYFKIVNESAGMWDGTSWFSNDSYLDPTARYYGHIKKKSNDDYDWTSLPFDRNTEDFYYDGFYKYPINKDTGLIAFELVDFEAIDIETWDEYMWAEYEEWELMRYGTCASCGSSKEVSQDCTYCHE